MSTLEWILLVGLALVVVELFDAVKALQRIGQILRVLSLGPDGQPVSASNALWQIENSLTKLQEQAERLADCYARATHDQIELIKLEEEARRSNDARRRAKEGKHHAD